MAKRKRHEGISPPAGGDGGFAPATENFHQTDESHYFCLQSHLCGAPKRDAQVLSFPESAVAAGRIYSFGSVSGGKVFTVGSYGSVTVRSECPARIISIIFGEENR